MDHERSRRLEDRSTSRAFSLSLSLCVSKMGGGASSQAAFEQMIAATMILGEAMVQGLDPRFVRFPDMYRLYDFHVGSRKQQLQQPQRSFNGGQMVLLVRKPDKHADDDDDDDDDDDEAIPKLVLLGDDGTAASPATTTKKMAANGGEDDDDDEGLPVESNDEYLVVYVAGDRIVLDKATLNQPNNDGWTPLHAACHTLNAQEAGITILGELVRQKADLNLVTKRGPGAFSCGWTPLHIAVAYGLEALALKLIRAGADVNTKNSVDWTPLYEACHRNYSSVARELLRAGAKHDVVCPEFAMCPYPAQRPLAEACRQGGLDTVKVLLDWGVDKNAVNSLGWTALHEAAYHNRVTIIKQLIVYGVDVMATTSKGSVARDLTIWSEIRVILDDLMKDTASSSSSAASPKKQQQRDEADDDKRASSSPKKSPSKAAPVAPLSRKEDYQLLGDLPALGSGSSSLAPAIAIKDEQDVADEDDEAKDDDGDTDTAKHKKKKKTKRSSKHGAKHGDVPAEFKCAVTRKLLKDPLRSPYGQVFERKVIEVWFRDFGNRCPLTGQPLAMTQLMPDDKLKAEIREWKHGGTKSKSAEENEEESTATRQAELPSNREAKPLLAAPTTPDIDLYDF